MNDSFMPSRVTRVGVSGKRSFDAMDKWWVVDACPRSSTSLSGLAMKAGENASQLCKWVRLHLQARSPATNDVAVHRRRSRQLSRSVVPRHRRLFRCGLRVRTQTTVVASVFALTSIDMSVGPATQWHDA
ncbi:hypothetical protein PCAR4_570013 [Paraburkholderia caribensis]|nr:hypothetical protein PCAR4_570013 [Paraburkholderia caribensis]